jgi:hypothetical protein
MQARQAVGLRLANHDPLVFSFTQNISERAYSINSNKSVRRNISPPLKTRKNMPPTDRARP